MFKLFIFKRVICRRHQSLARHAKSVSVRDFSNDTDGGKGQIAPLVHQKSHTEWSGFNPCLRSDKPAANRLSHATTVS
jgi:hypothetical protein